MSWQKKRLGSVRDFAGLIEEILDAMNRRGYGPKDAFAVRLAAEEAVANAFKHGHRQLPGAPVVVRYHVTPEVVLVEIKDKGPGFVPGEVPDPLAAENLERDGGRGLFLMRTYMTWVRHNERGNCVTLCRRRSGQ
jgi:serine/threonine-protein kinase RsbW